MDDALSKYLKKPGMELYLLLSGLLSSLSVMVLYIVAMSVFIAGIVEVTREDYVRELIVKVPEIEPLFTVFVGLLAFWLLKTKTRRNVGAILSFSIALLAYVDAKHGTSFGPINEFGRESLVDTASLLFIIVGVLFVFSKGSR